MTNGNITSNEIENYRSHSYTSQFKWPSQGKLKWIGGNLALACPVEEEVMDECGNVYFMSLEQVLNSIDEFEGYRCDTTIKANIIERCFCAYKYNLLTAFEKEVFEKFVRESVDGICSVEAARRLMLTKSGEVQL
jgi:hypothetical protein